MNAVALVRTQQAPLAFLQALQALELQAGRERPYRNAPRTLDLDIELWGAWQSDAPELLVPHPRMWERAFVLVPLAEIAPQCVTLHNCSKCRVKALCVAKGRNGGDRSKCQHSDPRHFEKPKILCLGLLPSES